jgi:hypothetical protein
MTKVFLTPQQKHSLNKWLEASVEKLNGKSLANVAGVATDELGFAITSSHIDSAIEATGVHFQTALNGGCEPSIKAQYQHNSLCEIVADICRELGIESSFANRAEMAKCRIGGQKRME